MPVHCIDGVISDDELTEWRAGARDVRVQLTRAQVRAALTGPCLARAVALLELSDAQIAKLFPSFEGRRSAVRLRSFAVRLTSPRVRAVLAHASWHQLRAAVRHQDENAQIRAAVAHGVARLATKPRRRVGGVLPCG